MPEQLDTRLVLRGFDGKLYHDGEFLAAVPEWTITLTMNSTDYQGAGMRLVAGVFVGFSQALTFTETHVTDELIEKLWAYLDARLPETFEFVGIVERADGEQGEYVCRSCEPSGDVNIAAFAPGQISERAWSWRVNEMIDPQKLLGRTA